MLRKTTDTNKFPSKNEDTPTPYAKSYAGFNPNKGKGSNKETDPFRSLINEWLDSCKADGLSLKTIEDYRDKLFKFWWWWDNNYASTLGKHPCNVSTREARAFAAYLRESVEGRWGITTATNNKFRQSQQLSPASIAAYGRSAKVFFNWLEREGYIEQTPFNKSVKFTNRHKQDHVLKNVSLDNIKSIFTVLVEPRRLRTYEGCRNLAIIAMLLDTGMRRGELLSLKLKDLDLVNGRCQIRGKTGQRWAVFSAACLDPLSSYLELYRSLQGDVPHDELWLTEEGEPFSYYGFGSMIRRLEEKSGVDFHAHKLRHSFATMMAAQGVNVFDLKEMMGHQSITTTQIYVQQDIERLSQIHRVNSPLTTLVKDVSSDNKVFRSIKRRKGRPRKEN